MPSYSDRPLDDLGHDATSPAAIPRRGWKQILLRVKDEIAQDHVGVVAAGIAFYGLIAIFPAIGALVAISGLILNPADLGQVMERIVTFLPPDAAAIIHDQLAKVVDGGTGTGVVAITGIGLALYGAMKGVMTLIEGLNIAYDEDEARSLPMLYMTGFGITLALIVGLILVIGLIVVLPAAAELLHLNTGVQTAIAWITWPILAGFVIIGLAVLYRFGPSRRSAKWRWLSLGATLATVLWIAASLGFSAYAANFGSYTETYGTLAGVIILLTWLWLSAYVILAGAELNAEIEQQTTRDTTTGIAKPMGQRGAVKADTPPPNLQPRQPLPQVSARKELLLASALASRALLRMMRERR